MFESLVDHIKNRKAGDVGAGYAGDATASTSKILGAILITFDQIWLDLGKIEAKFGQNLNDFLSYIV